MRLFIPTLIVASLCSYSAHSQTSASEEIISKWVGCLRANTVLFAMRNPTEPADTIVSGAFGACAKQQQTFRESLKQKIKPELIDNTLARISANFRPALIADVLEVRARTKESDKPVGK